MKRIKKQLLALLMAGTMITLLASCGDSEAGKSNSEYKKLTASKGLEFEVHESYCTVVDFGSCTDTEIVIPAEYEGLPVTTIGSCAFSKYNRLESDADYVAITKIYLPETITFIKDRAFWGCNLLEEVHIYSENVYVSEYAFWECSSLNYIDTTKLSMTREYIFADCTSLRDFVIPEGTTTVGERLLYECSSIKSLTIPVSMTSLPEGMCYGCTSLTDIYYNGTQEQWSAIYTGISGWKNVYFWYGELSDYTIHCTDGDIQK